MENLILLLDLEDIIKESKDNLRVTDLAVVNIDSSNYYGQLNTPTKANFLCLFVVESGVLVYTVFGEQYELRENDILFSHIAETFTINSISDDYKAKKILFSFEFVTQSGFNHKSTDLLKGFFNNPSSSIKNQPKLFEKLKIHISEIEDLNDSRNNNYYYNEMIWHHFSLLLYEVDNYFKLSEKQNSTTSRDEEITLNFFELIRTHLREQHEVQFYADKLCLTPKHLGKIIKKSMFKTPKEVLNHLLVIEAKLFLRNPGNNISAAARHLNFSEQAAFSKFFKKETNHSPSEYQKTDFF